MTSDQDDDLGIDLAAWEAPPPPPRGLVADAVLARMRDKTNVGVTPIEPGEGKRRRWLLVVGAAVAVAGTVAVATIGMQRAPKSGHGQVFASHAQHLKLGPSSAELDEGSYVTWKRDRFRVTAAQSGTATWHVGDDDSLTIDVGAGSIEARDANLRVEVHMKVEDKRTIATSAVTAATVAFVTILVYNGTVIAKHDGNTTEVKPGIAYQIKANGDNSFDEDAVVGANLSAKDSKIRVDEMMSDLEAKARQIQDLHDQIDRLRTATSPDPGPNQCDEVSCVLNNYEGDCCKRYRPGAPAMPESLDRPAISDGIALLMPKIKVCGADFNGRLKAKVKVKPDGTVKEVTVTSDGDPVPAHCVTEVIRDGKFKETLTGGSFGYPFVFTNQKKAACDPHATFDQGKEAFVSGQYAKSFTKFEESFQCKADGNTLKFVFAAACRSANVDRARFYWKKLPQSMKDTVVQFCVSAGITVDQLEGTPSTSRLLIANSSPAKILVDGKEIGTTPIDTTISPGRHKVTFLIGADKHTFVVNAKPGETVRLVKEIE